MISAEVWENIGDGQRRFVRRKSIGEVLRELNDLLRKYFKDHFAATGKGFTLAAGAKAFEKFHYLTSGEEHLACYVVKTISGQNKICIGIVSDNGVSTPLYCVKRCSERQKAWEIAEICADLFCA